MACARKCPALHPRLRGHCSEPSAWKGNDRRELDGRGGSSRSPCRLERRPGGTASSTPEAGPRSVKLRKMKFRKFRLAELPIATSQQKVDLTLRGACPKIFQGALTCRGGLFIAAMFEVKTPGFVMGIAGFPIEIQRAPDVLFACVVLAEGEKQASESNVGLGGGLACG